MPKLASPCLNIEFSVPDPALIKVAVTPVCPPPEACSTWENLGPIENIRVGFPALTRRRRVPPGPGTGEADSATRTTPTAAPARSSVTTVTKGFSPARGGQSGGDAQATQRHTAVPSGPDGSSGSSATVYAEGATVQPGGHARVSDGRNDWEIYSSCGVDCYARLGSAFLVNTADLLVGQQRIDAARQLPGYSAAFGLVLPPLDPNAPVVDDVGGPDEDALVLAHERYLKDEAEAMETRIKEFERTQRAQFEAVKAKASRDRRVMATLIREAESAAGDRPDSKYGKAVVLTPYTSPLRVSIESPSVMSSSPKTLSGSLARSSGGLLIGSGSLTHGTGSLPRGGIGAARGGTRLSDGKKRELRRSRDYGYSQEGEADMSSSAALASDDIMSGQVLLIDNDEGDAFGGEDGRPHDAHGNGGDGDFDLDMQEDDDESDDAGEADDDEDEADKFTVLSRRPQPPAVSALAGIQLGTSLPINIPLASSHHRRPR